MIWSTVQVTDERSKELEMLAQYTSGFRSKLNPLFRSLFLLGIVTSIAATPSNAQEAKRILEYELWSKGLNVPDPVAISFDSFGRAYVTQTTRRKANDLDIRNNRDWTVNDVSLQSVEQKQEFYRSRLSKENSSQNRRRARDLNGDGYHDFRDLQVLSEKIHLVTDSNQDGYADSIQVFAEGFQTEVTGIAAGVLHWKDADNQEAVYATIAPDVWKLTDSNGDGKADRREKVASGFGLHIAYAGHDMHGLTLGPDGKIYWSIGDKGISVRSREGNQFHFPNQGGVLRCNPDGSDFEVFAHGLRNVQELAFDQYGNLFGVDNDADQPGERERFVYIVKNMDAGWRCHYQYRGGGYNPWTEEGLWKTYHENQPAYIVPPIQYSINGPCGFAFNPGTALSEDYRNYFFLTGAPHGEQLAFRVKPDGASFRMEDVHAIGKGIALIGINFGPDGALYGVDWANGYPLNQKGGIWKIDVPEGEKDPARKSTLRLLGEDLHKAGEPKLLELLSHADQRIRLRAQFELVRRKNQRALQGTALNPNHSVLARVHAIWGLGQLCRKNQTDTTDWGKLVTLKNKELQVQVLRIIADLKTFDNDFLQPFLATESKRVLLHLYFALAKHGDREWLPSLVALSKRHDRNEVYLRHGLAQALVGCEVEKDLEVIRDSKNIGLKLATVVALRQLKSPEAAQFLNDENPAVRDEAARAIHDDFSIPAAMPRLAESLDPEVMASPAFVRRALSANFRLGKSRDLARVLTFLSDGVHSDLGLEALDLIGKWEQPQPLDTVTGRFRGLGNRKYSSEDKLAIESCLSELLKSGDAKLQAASVRTLGRLEIELNESSLLDLVQNSSTAVPLAIESLKKLVAQKSELAEAAVESAIKSAKPALRIAAIEIMRKKDPVNAMKIIAKSFREFQDRESRQRLIQLAAKVPTSFSSSFVNQVFSRYLEDRTGEEFALELVEAVVVSKADNPQSKLLWERYENAIRANGNGFEAGEFQLSLNGGDLARGKRLFETHLDAQCTRCHRVGKTGSSVGPPLDGIAKKRSSLQLLESIIEPSKQIEKEFQTLLVGLFDGKTVTGVKVRESKRELVLADTMGKEIKILKEDIEQIAVQKKSLMPDMKKTLTKREIRDLVAYLKSLKK